MEEIKIAEVKGRAIKGVLALTSRTFIIQIISFLGFFLLTIFLGREEIGLFFAISELIAILGYFSDIGLAAALIQKKEEPKEEEIKTTFTTQQILVFSLILIVFLLTPWLKDFFHISFPGIVLLWSLLVGFFLSSLKTIPSILLERKLNFDILALVEIFETIIFYSIAVFFAYKGFGLFSYALAVLGRGIIGTVLIYFFSPWNIGFAFKKDPLNNLLKFGIPYQLNSFLAVFKDRLMNVFLWKIIGAEGLGILGWSQKWSQMPLRLLVDNVSKVAFPAYSRLQGDFFELKKAIEKSLFFISLAGFPLFALLFFLIKPIILVIPKYQKWEPALFSFYLFSFNSIWAIIIVPLINTLNALGKVKTTLKIMIFLTILTWILTPPFAYFFGYNGVAIVSAILALTGLWVVWLVKKSIKIEVLKSIYKPFFASLAMSFLIFSLLLLIRSFFWLIFISIIGISFYIMIMFFWAKNEISPLVKKIFANYFFPKREK